MKIREDLKKLITGVKISSDGRVPLDRVEDKIGFESEIYEPEYFVSYISVLTLRDIKRGRIEEEDEDLEDYTISQMVLDSDLDVYAPDIYVLLRISILDSFSIVYSIEEKRDNIQYLNHKDIQRLKNNLNYLADYLGSDENYYHMVRVLRRMHISLGYIEHQLDVIMNYRIGGDRLWL